MKRFLKLLIDQKDTLLYLLLAVAALLSITFENINSRNAVSSAFMSAVSSLQNLGSGIGRFFDETVNSISELTRLQQEYEALSLELEAYRSQLQDIESLRFENQALRTLLDFATLPETGLIPVEVIAKTPGSFSEEFMINKGAFDGVALDDPVVAMQNNDRVLVGKVITVSDRQSLVLPVFSRSMFIAARLRDQRFEGLVNGSGSSTGTTLVMDFVDRQARNTVSVGDVVITSGFDSLYPRGLTIGTVQGIEAKSWETSIRLNLLSSVSFSTLEYLFILKTSGGN